MVHIRFYFLAKSCFDLCFGVYSISSHGASRWGICHRKDDHNRWHRSSGRQARRLRTTSPRKRLDTQLPTAMNTPSVNQFSSYLITKELFSYERETFSSWTTNRHCSQKLLPFAKHRWASYVTFARIVQNKMIKTKIIVLCLLYMFEVERMLLEDVPSLKGFKWYVFGLYSTNAVNTWPWV